MSGVSNNKGGDQRLGLQERVERGAAEDLAAALPGIFSASHADGSLTMTEVDEIASVFERRGRRPEDATFIRSFIASTSKAWTSPAIFRIGALFQPVTPSTGDAGKTVSDGRLPAIALPTTAQLLGGQLPANAFAGALNEIAEELFNGDATRMAQEIGVASLDLAKYRGAFVLPKSYKEVIAIGERLREVDGAFDSEGLANAWLADMSARRLDANPEAIFPEDGAPREVRRAAEILITSVALKLGRFPYSYGGAISALEAASLARDAITAGFDEQTVVGVLSDYFGTREDVFARAEERAKGLMEVNRPKLAQLYLRMAARASRAAATAAAPSSGGARAAEERSFQGVVHEATDVEGMVAAMSGARREAIEEFKASSPMVWENIVEAGRIDLVEQALALIDNGGDISFVLFSGALMWLARKENLDSFMPATLALEDSPFVIGGAAFGAGAAEASVSVVAPPPVVPPLTSLTK